MAGLPENGQGFEHGEAGDAVGVYRIASDVHGLCRAERFEHLARDVSKELSSGQ